MAAIGKGHISQIIFKMARHVHLNDEKFGVLLSFIIIIMMTLSTDFNYQNVPGPPQH